MEKNIFIRYLSDFFEPAGFKKRGNTWRYKGSQIDKLVTLQKSKFSNSYYINYGFIINSLAINNLQMHIFNRLSSLDDKENEHIMSLLDFENSISDHERKQDLFSFINKYILKELEPISTESELLSLLQKRPHLNDVPLIVKKHFDINLE